MTLGKCRGEQQQMWVPSAIERAFGERRALQDSGKFVPL